MALRAANRLLGVSVQSSGAALFTSSARVCASGGHPVGEMGHNVAERMGSKGQQAGNSSTAAKTEDKASSGGFVPSPDASPSPEAAGMAGGPGTQAMADMVNAVGGAFAGDDKRVERAAEDLTHAGDTGISPDAKPPHTTSQDWPRAGLASDSAAASNDTSEADVTRFEGVPAGDGAANVLPEVDQDPPENATAGPASVAGATTGYNARSDPVSGGPQRPL